MLQFLITARDAFNVNIYKSCGCEQTPRKRHSEETGDAVIRIWNICIGSVINRIAVQFVTAPVREIGALAS